VTLPQAMVAMLVVKLTAVSFQTPAITVIVVWSTDVRPVSSRPLRVPHGVSGKPCRTGRNKPGFCQAGRVPALLLEPPPPASHVTDHMVTLLEGHLTQTLA